MLHEHPSASAARQRAITTPPSAERSPTTDPPLQSSMRVTKRDGTNEPVDVNKIVRAVGRCCVGLHEVDALRVATRTISGLYDGATTRELDQLSIQTAAALIVEEPQYGLLAARLLTTCIDKEVRGQQIHAFSQSIATAHGLGLVNDRLLAMVTRHARKLDDAIVRDRDQRFEYFGLRTVYDRYLLRHPTARTVIETPQQFFLRIACALAESVPEALELYRLFSSLEYLPSSPTLFNAGTRHEQLSSCFLLDSPADHLEDIYRTYTDVALLSKFSGGIGLAYHRVRSRGSLIESTNGHSSGIVPWLKTLDASVAAVNQGGKRKGACCVYLEPWHADVEAFLELRDSTGDDAARAHNLNLASWIPDLFMRRVEADATWSLFDPSRVPALPDLWGEDFDRAYEAAEAAGLASKTVEARALYARMMRSLAQTGNGWMTFKDASNRGCNQTALPGRTVHLSNLCTEIIEVTSGDETAVCNLGSINLARHTIAAADGTVTFDFERLAHTVRTAVQQLDRVIDLNFYPIAKAKASNQRWRPVGLGVMGLQDVFFQMRLPFDAAEARALSARIAEEIYFHALTASADLADARGRHPAFDDTRTARGELQFDAWGVTPADPARWDALRARIRSGGLRNSLIIAIAPTATIASIAGCYECIEPQVSNLFKRETLSGDFIQVNRYLVAELKALGLWTEPTRARLKLAEGSVQGLVELPAELRARFRTAWELPMRSLIDMAADRGAFIDQSQSLNLFVESPNIGQLSSMYFHAWKRGLKTTYYLRSRPATKIAKATVAEPSARRRRRGRDRLLAREPGQLRGVPVSAVSARAADAASAASAAGAAGATSAAGAAGAATRPARLLDPGLCLTLRPMTYPGFFEQYRAAIKNTWTVEEIDLTTDLADLHDKLTDAERHLVRRLVAFFATGDSIVANNLVLNLYRHLNAPEARMYLSRQLYEEALHVQFYLTLLDTYLPDPRERQQAFAAIETIPSIQRKAAFCMRWLDAVNELPRLETRAHRRQFLLNLICFAACIEGLFFFGAFAYVYFLRSRGLLHGLAAGTSWVFRDESAHMAFAFEVVRTVRAEEPDLFDAALERDVAAMLDEAIECEVAFAQDLLAGGVAGLSVGDVRQYLQCCADQRLATLGMARRYGSKNPFGFLELQDVQEVTNFFERRVSAYQVGVEGEVVLDASF